MKDSTIVGYRLTNLATNAVRLGAGVPVRRLDRRPIPRTSYCPTLHYVEVIATGEVLTEPWVGFGPDPIYAKPTFEALPFGTRARVLGLRKHNSVVQIEPPPADVPPDLVWVRYADGTRAAMHPSHLKPEAPAPAPAPAPTSTSVVA